MHVCKGGWSGQVFALATTNDSSGRKSRIRRSKEERKSMVESFIKKYQESNNGTFPSLNLTHKEVGGSFYTVREIVREIIQENRVLAPPRVSLEEHGYSGFLEQHPLGTISMEPQIDLSESERVHMVMPILPNEYQNSSEENISSSSEFHSLGLDKEHIVNGVRKVADKVEGSDRTSQSHHPPIFQVTSIGDISNSGEESPLPKSHEFEDENIVNCSQVLDGSSHLDEPLITNVDHQNDIELSSENLSGLGSEGLINEQHHDKNDQMVDETGEFGVGTYTEPTVMETLEGNKLEVQDLETSEAIKSPKNSMVMVETFPLRPLPKTIHNVDGESGKLQEAVATLDDKAYQHEKKTVTQSSSNSVGKKGEEKIADSIVELKAEYRDENAKHPSASKPNVLIAERESKASSFDATKSSSCTNKHDQDNSSSSKGNNPTLNRMNLETWEAASKKSTRPVESNPLLALVKAFISSFVKFWTE